MPDFDKFERALRSALAGGTDSTFHAAAAVIASLEEINKPQQFKRRTQPELTAYLCRAHEVLMRDFGEAARFTTSDNNRLGSDLTEDRSGAEIEIKSGPARTDANIGVSAMAWMLDDDDGMLFTIMNDSMRYRRTLYPKHPALIQKSKEETMDRLFAFFAGKMTQGQPAPDRLTHASKCYARGVNNLEAIKASYDGKATAGPRQYLASWDAGLIHYAQAFKDDEELTVWKLARTTRVDLCLKGSVSSGTIQYYPNYKNSWVSGSLRVPASAWVNTPCFHVWIGRCRG